MSASSLSQNRTYGPGTRLPLILLQSIWDSDPGLYNSHVEKSDFVAPSVRRCPVAKIVGVVSPRAHLDRLKLALESTLSESAVKL